MQSLKEGLLFLMTVFALFIKIYWVMPIFEDGKQSYIGWSTKSIFCGIILIPY